MIVFTDMEAQQNFETMLDKAKKTGKILISRKDGSQFMVTPYRQKKSPLDVGGIDLKPDLNEITSIIREIRER